MHKFFSHKKGELSLIVGVAVAVAVAVVSVTVAYVMERKQLDMAYDYTKKLWSVHQALMDRRSVE